MKIYRCKMYLKIYIEYIVASMAKLGKSIFLKFPREMKNLQGFAFVAIDTRFSH